MSTATVQLNEIAAQWRYARRVYAIYGAVTKEFKLGPTCPDLDSPVDRNDPHALTRVRTWLAAMDEKVEAHQLRQILQVTQLGTDDNLRAVIQRILAHAPKSDADRDKLDFLLVQYFSQCAPPAYHQREVALDEIAQVLEPVLGECSTRLPDWMAPLDGLLDELHRCEGLGELLEKKVLERGRQLKAEAGQMYFGSAVMLAFVRFNFLVRRVFFRLMHNDLHAIRKGLHELESWSIHQVDCSLAGMSAEEPIAELRKICHNWKQPFRAAYSMGQSFLQMVKVRACVEEAVRNIDKSARAQAAELPAAVAPAPAPFAEPVAVAPAVVPVEETLPALGTEDSDGDQTGNYEVMAEPPADASDSVVVNHAEEELAATPAPAERVAPAPAAKTIETSAQPASAPPTFDLQPVVELIAEELISGAEKKGVSVTAIHIGETKLLLASWEVAAFVRGGDDVSDALQRAVAARAVLCDLVDRYKKAGSSSGGDAARFAVAVETAHAEAAALQDHVAEAKKAQNIDAAVNLAATGKRLQTIMDEAAKLEA